MQAHIRSLRPLRFVDEVVALGIAGKAVVAVSNFAKADDGTTIIRAIATAQAARGQGIARQTLGWTMSYLRHPMQGGRFGSDVIFARIDQRNDASRELFKSVGFEFVTVDGRYERWGIEYGQPPPRALQD